MKSSHFTASQPLLADADRAALVIRAIAARKRREYRDVWSKPPPAGWVKWIETSERVARKLVGVTK